MNSEAIKRPYGLRRAWWYHILPIAALTAIDVAFCFMLDTTFSEHKKQVISTSRNFNELTAPFIRFAEQLDEFMRAQQTRLGIRDTEQKYFERHHAAVEELARNILSDPDNPYWRIVVEDRNENVLLLVETPGKLVELNTWENCMISRDFSGELVRVFTPNGRVTELWARIRVSYASPKNWAEIHRLLFRYWLALGGVAFLSILLYVWLNRAILRPLVRVAAALEVMARDRTVPPIRHATTVFERTLNGLIESQRPVHLQREIDRALREIRNTHHPDDTSEALLDRLPSLISGIYESTTVALYRWDGGERMYRTTSTGADTGIELPEFIPVDRIHEHVEMWPDADECEYWLAPLRSRGRLAGAILANLSGALDAAHAAESIQSILENGLEAARTDADRLAEERNRFGMTLATSMGHDLTNIIATGKWDLQTLEKARDLGIIQVDPPREEFYSEAVTGLRQNLHFLQDIVDIYRAVGYARRPTFERTDLGALMREVTELFSRSTSRRLEVQYVHKDSVELIVEPRLLKMVVFNLLANASQVIQNRSDGKSGGRIEVAVESDPHGAVIVVRDNGPGIRGHDGELLPEDELHKIFRAGYTTKPPEASGGLGLSWAKHIIEDFHGGKITAHNQPGGGAAFHLVLPTREIPGATLPS